MVNEFGKVSVDHQLINVPRPRMRVIDGGCLCGHVHEEVATSLLDLEHRRGTSGEAYFDRVLIETSGLADPVPIIQVMLTDPLVTRAFELRAVVTVADGVSGAQHLVRHPESKKQAAVADLVVISKTDVAEAHVVQALREALLRINPSAAIVAGPHGCIEQALLDQANYSLTGRTRGGARVAQ